MGCSCKVFDKKHAEYWHEIPQIAVCRERRSKYSYDNQKRQNYLALYHVDGGIITRNDAKKCDYLLINCDQKEAFFIELKGSDLIQAIRQIDVSIESLKEKLANNIAIHARIVLTRVNTTDLKNTRLLNFEKKIKRLGGSVRKESQEMIEVNQ